MERGKGKTSGLTTGSTGTLLTGKTYSGCIKITLRKSWFFCRGKN
jgi:hypothetical protein